MDLSLESIKLPPWDPVRAEEWNAAYEKVENYLRACRVSSHLHRARLTALILLHVYEKQKKGMIPETMPLSAAAILETRVSILKWLEPYLSDPGRNTSVSFGEAMLALYLGDGPTMFPYAFLDSAPMPQELLSRIRKRIVQAGPGLAKSSMVARDPDLAGVPELVGNAVERITSSPMLKALVSWALFLLIAGIVLFWYTRR